ncbi:MAG: Stp1/IreP family PP2C-type Ser/Thr phosphatase [Thermodesulfobacteriota bacterium]|nr:Stp1/IreP family PP2C-type Ser/Thr phosphatase [Thermodesulfobacteriota bacterium]
MQLTFAGKTDVGKKRKNNEDNFGYDEKINLFLLADGMGGHLSGEVASKIAIDTILKNVNSNLKKDNKIIGEYKKGISPEANKLASSIRLANQIIYEASQEKPEYRGMGTTLVSLFFLKKTVIPAYVGDSRIYLIRDGAIEQISEDHSLVQEQIKRGIISESEAETVDYKNIITRALGVEPGVEVDTDEILISKGDIFLLCSDGLTDLVKNDEILNIINTYKDLNVACNNLIDLANNYGGIDNITVILIRVEDFKKHSGVFAPLVYSLFNWLNSKKRLINTRQNL